jgi:hypothetical protein
LAKRCGDRLIRETVVKGYSAALILVRRGGSELYLAVKAARGKDSVDPLLYHPAERSA